MSSDPSTNLAFILRASGLSQAQIAAQIEQRGFSINRSTINRWANPGKVGLLKTDPILLKQVLAVCGEAIGLSLTVDDLYSPGDDLERKCRFAREGSYLLDNLVSRCVSDFSARRMSPHLCGHYKTFMMSLFDPTRLRMSLMEIENDDDVAFRCRIHVLRNNRLADDNPTLSDADAALILSGRMLFLGGVCHFMLESRSDPAMAVTIAARVPNAAPPVEVLDGLITIYGSPGSASVVVSRYLMVRATKANFDELRTTRQYGELPADYKDANWVISRLTRGFGGPHLVAT